MGTANYQTSLGSLQITEQRVLEHRKQVQLDPEIRIVCYASIGVNSEGLKRSRTWGLIFFGRVLGSV